MDSACTHLSSHIQPSSPRRHAPKIVSLDLADPSSFPDKVQQILEAFGRVDILVNNAGVSSRGSVLETDTTVDRKLMEINFFGPITLTKGDCHCLPWLINEVMAIDIKSLPPSSSPLHAGTGRWSHCGHQQPPRKDWSATKIIMSVCTPSSHYMNLKPSILSLLQTQPLSMLSRGTLTHYGQS